mmetsp:Transcript_33571/g.66521  ORF Transcript_33571/g.66521 Transcript_33571/m.66521 type:complete len:233 (+) Transcript_33571:388-1086(+)
MMNRFDKTTSALPCRLCQVPTEDLESFPAERWGAKNRDWYEARHREMQRRWERSRDVSLSESRRKDIKEELARLQKVHSFHFTPTEPFFFQFAVFNPLYQAPPDEMHSGRHGCASYLTEMLLHTETAFFPRGSRKKSLAAFERYLSDLPVLSGSIPLRNVCSWNGLTARQRKELLCAAPFALANLGKREEESLSVPTVPVSRIQTIARNAAVVSCLRRTAWTESSLNSFSKE